MIKQARIAGVATNENKMQVELLLETSMLTIRDICCNGACRHLSPSECATATHLVFPYRGAFARHVGKAETIAEASQLIFFNAFEEYAISHPADGGDASLSISIAPELLLELAPSEQLNVGDEIVFNSPARGIDPRAQALAALLRHGLTRGAVETLEAETLAISLIARALGERTSHVRATSYGRAKLVDRTKLLLADKPGRRWTLNAIAAEIGVSPVYLTQIFAQAEGIPLYRYQLRLRLAHALDRLGDCEDITMLALDLGFSSHSHFTAAFRQHFGQSPTAFQRSARLR